MSPRTLRRVLITLASALTLAAVVPSLASAHCTIPGKPTDPFANKLQRVLPKAPGTKEHLYFWFGPYVVPPGWDANRLDIDLPPQSGMILAVEPCMKRVGDLKEPVHQEAHIHHAHWFGLDPGNKEDNYTGGNTEWIFGNGDEETKADFQERSAADPNGPIYGQYIGADGPQLMIYMLHNKTPQPLFTWIALDVTFVHGTLKQLNAISPRPYHDVSGVLFGRTYNVPRKPTDADGVFETPKDDPRGVIQWTSTIDGTLIGTGGHLHPGGKSVIVENYGSRSNPCPDDGRGYGGTMLLRSDALFRNAPYSEDFQMEVSKPAFRAPIHKGDRIRIAGIYEDRDHAWYTVMTHEGMYIDEAQPPIGRCKPYLVGPLPRPVSKKQAKRMMSACARGRGARAAQSCRRRVQARLLELQRALDPAEGVPNRPWGVSTDRFCGPQWGGAACEKPDHLPTGHGVLTDTITIANFLYTPGDRTLSGSQGQPVRVKQGHSLTFFNADQLLNIRHTATTCTWPCNGTYVANYPLADGRWDSGTLGYDAIDGGRTSPFAHTPKNLSVGKYAFFCRIHPWMRGAFEVVP